MKRIYFLILLLCSINLVAFGSTHYYYGPKTAGSMTTGGTYCGSASATLSFTVNTCQTSGPSSNTGDAVTVCWYVNTISPSFTGATLYATCVSSVCSTSGTTTVFKQNITQSTAGTYYYACQVTYTASSTTNSCSPTGGTVSSAFATVTVNPLPAAISNFPSAAICPNSPVTLTDGTSGGTWSSGTGSVATVTSSGANSAILNGVGAGTSVIAYTAGGCSVTATATISPGPAIVTATPTIATSACGGGGVALAASGGAYSATVTAMSQDFNSGLGTWTVDNTGSTSSGDMNWTVEVNGWTEPGGEGIGPFHSPDNSQFAAAVSDLGGGGSTTSSKLISPSFSLAGYTSATLTFQTAYDKESGDVAIVELSTDGGNTWPNTIKSFTSTTGSYAGFVAENYSLTAYVGQTNCMIRFRYSSGFGFYWAVDNVVVSGTQNSPATFTWSPNTNLTCNPCTSPTATPTVPTTYTVSTTANGCTSSATTGVISISQAPTANISPSVATTTCSTQLLAAVTDIGNTYQWYNNTAAISGATNATYTASVTGSYYVAIGQSTTSCTANSPNVVITVSPITASITPAGPVTVCGSQMLNAVTNFGNAYQWYNSSGIITGATGNTYTAANTGVVAAANNYSVQVTNAGLGCSATSSATSVTLNPVPTATITTPGGITAACGGIIVMSGNTNIGDTYQWSNNSGTISGATSATYAANATGTYFVNIKQNSTGCNTNSAITTITINAVPTASVSPSGTVTTCGNQLLTASTDIGNQYQWYSGPGIISNATNNTYTAINTSSVVTTNTYSVVVTNTATNCSSNAATATVTLDPVPEANITTPGNITGSCSPITMTGNTDIGNTYQWSNSSGVISGATSGTYTATVTGTYSVNIKQSSTGCNTNSTGLAINIIPAPSASLTPSGIVSTCSSQLLTASTDLGNAYQWYNSSGVINGATNNTYIVNNTGSVPVTDIYSVQVINSITGCSSMSPSATVTVNPGPSATITTSGGITSICGSSIVMTANTNIGDTYQWSNSSGIIAGATNNTYTAILTGTYSVNIKQSTTGCNTNSATTAITINAVPSAAVSPSGTVTVCGSQLLTALTNIGNSYQWYNGSGIISGATGSSYSVVNGGATSVTNTYSVVVTNSLTTCNSTSPATTVILNAVPTSSVTPAGTVTACGSQVLIAGTNIGNRYQWYNGSGIITGATNNSYTVSNTGSVATTDVYSVMVTNSGTTCNSTSAGTTVILNPIPTASILPTGTVTACGSELLTAGSNIGNAYQWYSNTGGAISGATNNTYTAINNGSVSVTAIYSVQVTNSSTTCNSTSPATTVILNAIPTSSVTPAGTVTACGSQVLIAGTNIGNRYQWYNGSGIITGATNNSYTVSNTGSVATTDVYSVMVTNSGTTCNSTSAGTTVILNPIPTASILPTGTVTACGSELLTAGSNIGNAYQWYSNTGGAISGATNNTYTAINNGSVSVTAIYSVQVTNSSTTCNSTSPATTVILNAIPTSSVTPAGTVTACGSQVLTAGTNIGNRYQWYNGSGIITGATNNSYTVSNTGSVATTDVYSVMVTNSGTTCNSTSAGTTVILNPIPTASVTPAGTVTACGSELLTAGSNIGNVYQWYSNTGGAVSGATNNTYTAINNGSVSVTAIYSVQVTNSSTTCNLTSAGTTVILNPIPTSSVTPAGTVTACGSQVLTAGTNIGNRYQWYNGSGIITGATNNSYTVSNTGSVATTDVYSVMVTNSGTTCNSTSAGTTVILNPIPASTVTTAGGLTTNCGSLVLTGTSNIGDTYQWYNSSGAIAGATNLVYTATVSSTYYMKAGTAATGCNSNSASFVITINPYPVVTVTASGPTTFCAGSSVTLATNSGYTYQWQNYGVNIAGATNNSYTSSQGGIFRVALSSPASCLDTTSSTTVTVNPLPSETITAGGPLAFCAGGSVILSAQTGLSTYQWVNPVNGVGGANSNTYTATASGSYRVVMTTNSNCRDTSMVLVVTAEPLPNNTVTVSGATTFCEGGSVTLTGPSGMSSYQWHDGAAAIGGAAGQSYSTGTSGTYKVFISNGQCSDSSVAQVVTNASADTSIAITGSYRAVPGGIAICTGNALSLNGVSGAGSYQWDSATVAIPGANSQNYAVTETGVYTLIMNSSFGCKDSVSRKVEVDTLPVPVIYEYGYGLQTTQVYSSYQWYLNGVAIPGATSRDYLASTEGPYTVEVTNADDCSGMSASKTLNNLGVGNITGIDISLYPNPSSSVVYIQSPVKVKAVVYTIEGQEIVNKEDAKSIDLGRFANGTYMIKLFGEDGNLLKVSKLVKSE